MYVIFVDDDADVRAATTELLEMAGVEVDAFSDGHEALDAIAARTPDAVLLDLNMPVDGFTVARAARRRFARTLRLVAFTAVGGPEHRSAAFAAGFDAFLVKPCTARVILDAITAQAGPKNQS